ncbi:MAG: HU family DNA-binding protein [Desulfobacterales bacterium]|jgi:nucleoid DNA-binding protein
MPLLSNPNKTHIIEAVVSNNSYTLQKASESVEKLLELIKFTLEKGEYVLISSFGIFGVKKNWAEK